MKNSLKQDRKPYVCSFKGDGFLHSGIQNVGLLSLALHAGIQCVSLLSVALHAGAFSGHFPVLALPPLAG